MVDYISAGLMIGLSLAIATEVRGYFRERNCERKFHQVCEEHTRITKDLSELLKDDNIKIEFK
jgi:hypothetical protein